MPDRQPESRQCRELVRHFFSRFLENDLMSPDSDMRATVSSILVLLAVPGALFSVFLIMKYFQVALAPHSMREAATWFDKMFFITYSMVVMGMATVIEWDALFPDRRDYVILTVLPIRVRTAFLAKAAALVGFLLIVAVDINALSPFFFSMVVLDALPGEPTLARFAHFAGAHAAAVFGAAAFVFCLLIAAQGVLMNLLGPRGFRRVSRYAQFVAILALISAFLFFPAVSDVLHSRRPGDQRWVRLFPPAWFFGLYQTWLGIDRPLFRDLAETAKAALGCVAPAAALAWLLSYARHYRRSLESAVDPAAGPSLPGRAAAFVLDRLILRRPRERAVFHFLARTVMRGRKHRLYLCGYACVGLALVMETVAALVSQHGLAGLSMPGPPRVTPQMVFLVLTFPILFLPATRGVTMLAVPLVLSFFVLCGLRVIFAIPAELKSNWIFRVAGSEDRRDSASAVRKFMLLAGALPAVAAVLPLYLRLWGWQMALAQTAVCVTQSLVLIEILLLRFDKIPFTCSYLPGKSNMTKMCGVYLWAFAFYAHNMAFLVFITIRRPAAFAFLYACLAGVLIHLVRRRRKELSESPGLQFEDRGWPVVTVLNIGRVPTLEA